MDWYALIGLLGALAGIIFGYLAFSRTRRRDESDEGKAGGVILTEIGYIKANTDEIKAEQKEQRAINTEIVSRLTAVEASAKQAHRRLDAMDNQKPR